MYTIERGAIVTYFFPEELKYKMKLRTPFAVNNFFQVIVAFFSIKKSMLLGSGPKIKFTKYKKKIVRR